MTKNCTVSIGENNQVGWSSHGKSNSSNSGLHGPNINVTSIIYDNDEIDTPIMNNEFISIEQNDHI